MNKNYKDNDPSFDYVAEVLNPTPEEDKREALAILCMEAYFLEGGCSLAKYRPKAAHIIEQLAIRLMGSKWYNDWGHDVTQIKCPQCGSSDFTPDNGSLEVVCLSCHKLHDIDELRMNNQCHK